MAVIGKGGTMSNSIPIRLRVVSVLLRLYPLKRGQARVTNCLLTGFNNWPKRASFSFRFGRFVDVPIAPWPWGYRELFLTGIMDKHEVAIWKRVLRNGDTAIDGGANFGYWSLVAARLVGKSGRVHAFEPVPATFRKLQQNLSASGAQNIITHLAALADYDGKLMINVFKDDPISTQSSLAPRVDMQFLEKVTCDVVTLDSVLGESSLRLIKLDIEGGELGALHGAEKILGRTEKPVVTFEWNRRTARSFGYTPEDTQRFLEGYGYAIFIGRAGKLVPFVEPKRDNPDEWIPMLWALTKEHQNEIGL